MGGNTPCGTASCLLQYMKDKLRNSFSAKIGRLCWLARPSSCRSSFASSLRALNHKAPSNIFELLGGWCPPASLSSFAFHPCAFPETHLQHPPESDPFANPTLPSISSKIISLVVQPATVPVSREATSSTSHLQAPSDPWATRTCLLSVASTLPTLGNVVPIR